MVIFWDTLALLMRKPFDLLSFYYRQYKSCHRGTGLIADTSISAGDYGMVFGNQQWTFRDVSITSSRITAIEILWNWVFVFVGLEIKDCPIGITWPMGKKMFRYLHRWNILG